MKKELEELRDKYGFELQCSEVDGLAVYAMKEKKPIFVNTIGEKFYNKEDRVYWFSKNELIREEGMMSNIVDVGYTKIEGYSQLYKTEASRDKALEEYKESLKPKYRAFKLEEADEYLGMKIDNNKTYMLIDLIYKQHQLDTFFDQATQLDGSPVGKFI